MGLRRTWAHSVHMSHAGTLACLSACVALGAANARDSTHVGACPISATAVPVRYTRLHQIPTAAPRDDVSHKVVTPGGMILDTPKMVAATDVLTITGRDSNVLCFDLLTFARDRHTCKVTGVARKESGHTYLFRDDSVVVRFTFVEGDQIRVEPVGVGDRSRCEESGEIARATYTLSPAAD